jgi:hypothetical protein
MLKKIFHSWVTWVIVATGIVLYLKSKSTATATPTGTVDNVIITRTPPPGYSGPLNGPFTWASAIGEPPDGKWVVLGDPVT